MTDKKILFTDLDDTLLDSRKRISPKNREAVHEALAAGHRIVFNTGRPLPALLPQLEELELTGEGCYAAAYNGGLIYDCCRRESIFKKTIPLADVAHIFQQARRFGLYCQTYDDVQVLSPARTAELEEYVSKLRMPYRIVPELPDGLVTEPVKVLVSGWGDRSVTDIYLDSMAEWSKGRIAIFYSGPVYLDHVAAGISKGGAILRLCDILGIPLENTVAAGDSENDISMLQTARTGVAVANAREKVKAAADQIASHDCDHDAVAEIIYKYILE